MCKSCHNLLPGRLDRNARRRSKIKSSKKRIVTDGPCAKNNIRNISFATDFCIIFLCRILLNCRSGLQVKMKKPVMQESQVEIIRSGQFYTLLLGKQISVSWDRGTRLLVHISSTYRVQIYSCTSLGTNSAHLLHLKNIYIYLMSNRAGCAACAVTLMGM